ncbi:unnamed protein product [Oppiella nova]|uniref:Uncharacterized protein n=1 Tax=Oppiella nova TaxID=334625 RepID=A0A7R9QQK6_9ACAR|nr:unnamed protein product [Oppiella nova]CAG2170660.1 unnamed protein product [Oppiella nova]
MFAFLLIAFLLISPKIDFTDGKVGPTVASRGGPVMKDKTRHSHHHRPESLGVEKDVNPRQPADPVAIETTVDTPVDPGNLNPSASDAPAPVDTNSGTGGENDTTTDTVVDPVVTSTVVGPVVTSDANNTGVNANEPAAPVPDDNIQEDAIPGDLPIAPPNEPKKPGKGDNESREKPTEETKIGAAVVSKPEPTAGPPSEPDSKEKLDQKQDSKEASTDKPPSDKGKDAKKESETTGADTKAIDQKPKSAESDVPEV